MKKLTLIILLLVPLCLLANVQDDPRVNKSSKKTSFVEGPGAKIFQERVRKAALEERAKEKKYEKSLGGIDISKYLKDRGIEPLNTGIRPLTAEEEEDMIKIREYEERIYKANQRKENIRTFSLVALVIVGCSIAVFFIVKILK